MSVAAPTPVRRAPPGKSPRRKALLSLLVKPAGPDCNMACGYCFYRDKGVVFPAAAVHRMNDAVLEETMRQALGQPAPAVSIGWQGGEPTLMGLPFFERAVELQIKHGRGKTVGNALQTNGLLLDRAWARFLRESRFLVGLSLDGPEPVHDRYRARAGGGPTWAAVVDRARMLIGEGVETNALVVVDDYSVNFSDEIYGFLKELGLVHMQFIPCVETDPADPSRGASFSATSEAYGDFLVRLFDLWTADFRNGEPTTFIRLFDSLFFLYVDREPPDCTLLPECGTYLVVEHNGDVFACDFFVEERWKLGNVMSGKLIHMLNSARQTAFGRIKAKMPGECRSCPWLAFCRGGCTKDRLRDPRDGGLNHFCAGTKRFLAHADARFRSLAEEWQRRNSGA
jgi:uncharacterized protein